MAQTAILAQNDNLYQRTIKPSVGRSAFDLSHSVTLDIDFGQIQPICCIPTVPSDSFEISNCALLKQLSALKVPLMARMTLVTAYYWCDNRLSWKKWDRFITKGRSGTEVYNQPILGNEETGLSAIATNALISETVRTQFSVTEGAISPDDCPTAFPWYDYQIICRDFYTNIDRLPDDTDEWSYANLFPADPDDFKLKDGFQTYVNGVSLENVRYHNVREDYFTSSLKAPLRGNEPTIQIATGTIPRIVNNVDFTNIFTYSDEPTEYDTPNFFANLGIHGKVYQTGSEPFTDVNFGYSAFDFPQAQGSNYTGNETDSLGNFKNSGVTIDSSKIKSAALNKLNSIAVYAENVPITVNSSVTAAELTLLSQLTTFQTLNMLAEPQYNSMLNAHFENVSVGESAVEKPQFIGGTTQYININEITQTTGSSDSQLGYQGATANSFGTGTVGRYFCNDYGYIIGVAYVIPDLLYKPAIPRYMNYKTPEEYYFPEFSNISMQAILNKEIFVSNNSDWNNQVFGYQGRYDELRSIPNRVQGRLCGTEQDIKNFVLMREFDNSHKPSMSSAFLSLKNNVNKTAWNVPTMPPFILQVANYIKAYRPMPYVAVPKYL